MLKKVDGLRPIADELGVPLSQLAIAWCASNPNVSSVITGATKESQVSIMAHFLYTSFLYAIELLDSFPLSIHLVLLVRFLFRYISYILCFRNLRDIMLK